MEIKQPSATFPGFRHIHRGLLPGESIPRVPTLIEQLQALSGSAMHADTEAEAQDDDEATLVEESEDDEEWVEAS
jgi:hypothetical protein